MNRGMFMMIEDYGYGTILYDILKRVNIDQYFWAVDCLFLIDNEPDDSLVEGIYLPNEFKDAIAKEHIPLFIRIRAYPLKWYGQEIEEVEDYQCFMKSRCEIVLLCSDGGYYEIYAKNPDVLQSIRESCQRIKHNQLEYITDQNDGRTRFDPI